MRETELPGMNSNFNSMLNHNQIQNVQGFHHNDQSLNLDPSSCPDDFIDQILSSVPSSFPWADDQLPMVNLEDQSAASLASKMRQQQISNGAAKLLMLQQQLLPHADQNNVVNTQSFNSANLANDVSVKAAFNAFNGTLGQFSSQSQHTTISQQPQNFSAPVASGSSGGGGSGAGQPRQRVRARRGQATDPHSIAERLRRERIAERMKSLQELVPNANKTDKASMLDEIIDYVKFLQLQVKVLSMSRLGGAAAVAPLVADKSPQGRSGDGTPTAGMNATEQQVTKLMEEDMGSAMQYLQGKGLCLMPISLATAISTTTSNNHPLLNGGPSSPSMSVLTVQSAAGEMSAASKLE